jgi:hypothetical protein
MRYFALFYLASFAPVTYATTINWAAAQTSTNVTNPAGVLGAPDGANAGFVGSDSTLTASQFVQSVTYNDANLAAALGLVSLPTFDVILIEFNGTAGFGWESSTFSFTDGGAPLTMQYNNGSSVGTPNYIVAVGTITPASYQSIFGASINSIWDAPYMLLNLGAAGLHLGSPAFQVTVSSFNGGTPDPDVIGVRTPEPSSIFLFLSAMGALAVHRRRIQTA